MFDELINQIFIRIYLKYYQVMFGETWCFSAFVAIFIFSPPKHQSSKVHKINIIKIKPHNSFLIIKL